MRVLMICPELPASETPGSMAPAARQIRSLEAVGITTDIVDMSGIPKLKYLMVIPRIRRLVRRCDLIHAHFGYCGWLAKIAPLGQWSKKPIVMSFMGDDLLGTPKNEKGDLERLSRWMVAANKRLARRVDQVIVKSQEMAEVVAPTPATVIPNGVDTTIFTARDRQQARHRLGLPSQGKLVLFPGNPENPRKGFQFAQEAVQTAALKMRASLQLVPLWNVAPDQVADYMNACDAMVMTSLIEGSPNVVKEAMACDTPIIGVPVGDVAEQLQGVEGCRLSPRDVTLFAGHLADVLKHHPRSQGRQAIVARQLDLASVAQRIISVYELALAGRRSSAQSSKQIASAIKRAG